MGFSTSNTLAYGCIYHGSHEFGPDKVSADTLQYADGCPFHILWDGEYDWDDDDKTVTLSIKEIDLPDTVYLSALSDMLTLNEVEYEDYYRASVWAKEFGFSWLSPSWLVICSRG